MDHAVVADGVGIVVRDGDQVAWVRRDGCTVAHIDFDLWLAAADPTTAWFVDRSHIDPGVPPAPPTPLPPGRIIALRSDGSRTEVPTSTPVLMVVVRENDVWVNTAELPIAHPGGYGSWGFEYPDSTLKIDRAALLADGIASGVPSTLPDPDPSYHRPYSWTWLQDDPATVLRSGISAGGLIWWAGAPMGGDYIHRGAIATGHDPVNGLQVVRVDLGLGMVSDVQTVNDEVWLSVQRRRSFPSSPDRGVDVLAVSAGGVVRTVYSADSIDISQFAPPLNRPSEEEIAHHIEQVRQKFDDLTDYWDKGGTTRAPLSEGLTNSSVKVEGQWPDTRVVVTFEHRRRPGLVLRRTLPVFDDEGRPVDHEYADIYLMEDLDTNHIAHANDAVGGILDT